jgi:hypothetical protein
VGAVMAEPLAKLEKLVFISADLIVVPGEKEIIELI